MTVATPRPLRGRGIASLQLIGSTFVFVIDSARFAQGNGRRLTWGNDG